MTAAAPRYIFSGHAIGAAAQFHTLDDTPNLNHVVPTLAASVLPSTGGLSQGRADHYGFSVDHPRRRNLLTVRRIRTCAEGREVHGKFETEVTAVIESLRVVDKLHIDEIRLHMLAIYKPGKSEPLVVTKGNKIEGMSLGKVRAVIELDDEPLCNCGHQAQLAEFYRRKDPDYRSQNAWRFRTAPEAPEIEAHGGRHVFSLVRKIELKGTEEEKQGITVDGYTIIWKGFGKIILGEVHLKGNDRQVTMVRLAMGSDAGGTGSAGDGKTNGVTGS